MNGLTKNTSLKNAPMNAIPLADRRIAALEDDMKVIKALIKQNNDTLTALMDAVKAEQSK